MEDSEQDFVCRKRLKLSDDDRDMTYASTTAVINKLSSIKHALGCGQDKLAELFRKDLISAMKLPDSEMLRPEEYFRIADPWRQEWEKGVQVPINPDLIKSTASVKKDDNMAMYGPFSFKLPKKYLHAVQDSEYKQGVHELHEMYKLSEQVCRYDLDHIDVCWLRLFNQLRADCGDAELSEWEMERVIEGLETQCYEGMQQAIKTVEGLGIEYDEDAICDVCRDPEVEEGNEMLFCDGCDVSVHQACYGIETIPTGNWLCRTCALELKPNCIFCPITGGAMKCTEDGEGWAHLSCALWIPEVILGSSSTMEPVCGVDKIPPTRWSLVCTVCRERCGACIQCSVKKCKTAFHVTCAYQENFEMKQNLDCDSDDVQMKAYCRVHSNKANRTADSPRKTPTSTPKKLNDMTDEEKCEERSKRLSKLAEEFYLYTNISDLSHTLDIEHSVVDIIRSYWVLKRKCNFNKALLTPKVEEGDLLSRQREDSLITRLKMFIHLRQDLERVRNLCYMVTKREKMRQSLHQTKRDLFLQQSSLLRAKSNKPDADETLQIRGAHRLSQSLYDQPELILSMAAAALERQRLEDEEEDESPVKSSGKMAGCKFQSGKKRRNGVTDSVVTPVSATSKKFAAGDKKISTLLSNPVLSKKGVGKSATLQSLSNSISSKKGEKYGTPQSNSSPKKSSERTMTPSQSISSLKEHSSNKGKKYTRRMSPDGNPYVRPTYSSFSWMLSARRRSKEDGSSSTTPSISGRQESLRNRRSLPVFNSSTVSKLSGLTTTTRTAANELDRTGTVDQNEGVNGDKASVVQQSDTSNTSSLSFAHASDAKSLARGSVRHTTSGNQHFIDCTVVPSTAVPKTPSKLLQSPVKNRPMPKAGELVIPACNSRTITTPNKRHDGDEAFRQNSSPNKVKNDSKTVHNIKANPTSPKISPDENRLEQTSRGPTNGLLSKISSRTFVSDTKNGVKRLKDNQNLNAAKARRNGSLNGLQRTLDSFVVIKPCKRSSIARDTDETDHIDVGSEEASYLEHNSSILKDDRVGGRFEVTLNDVDKARPSTPSNDSVVLEEVTRSGQTKRTSKWQMSLSALQDDQLLNNLANSTNHHNDIDVEMLSTATNSKNISSIDSDESSQCSDRTRNGPTRGSSTKKSAPVDDSFRTKLRRSLAAEFAKDKCTRRSSNAS